MREHGSVSVSVAVEGMSLRPFLTEVLMGGDTEWEKEWGKKSDREEGHSVPRLERATGPLHVGGRVARRQPC